MESLRFLMVSTHFPPFHLGGDAVYVEYLARELVKLGHEVHVLHNPSVYGVIRKDGDSDKGDSPDDGIHRHALRHRFARFDTLNSLMLGMDRRAKRHVGDLVRETRADIIHWHNTRGFAGAPSVFGGEIALYTSHDYGSICPRSNLLRPNLEVCDTARFCTICCARWRKPPQLWRAGSKRVIRYPENVKIIAPSSFLAERLRREGVGVTHVLRNFVPDPHPERLQPKGGENSIIYLGMLEIHKGLRTLMKAFDESIGDHGFVLDIVGDGSLRQEVCRTGAGSRERDRVRIHGFLKREEAERLRRQAAAQVVPSEWFENCPLTILEAFAWGVPVVGANIGGIPEIVGPESGSRLFKSGDQDALAKVLVELWSERDRVSRLREKARSTYESRFRPEMHLREYLDIVRS